MNKLLLVFFTFFSVCGLAQKTNEAESQATYRNETCRSSFHKVTLEGSINAETVTRYLKKTLINLADYRTGLKLNYRNESPGGFHYSFTQTFNGVKIYQSEIKVNIDRRNTIYALFDNSENTSGWSVNTSGADKDDVIAIHPQKNVPVVCGRKVTDDGFELLVCSAEIIFRHDLKAYANQDSLVSGKVFSPDPLTTAQETYRIPYVDDTDRTSPAIDAQMQTVSFNATFNGSLFLLQSPFLKITEFSPPTFQPVTSATGQFYYDRSQEGFEDVNAFYHISTIQNHIHQLGFGCADSLVEADTHATPEDNSYFLAGNVNRIFLGTGGVDDAEDADVCVHEYGHFVSETASPGSNNGRERESLDEAFGDYLAASYSRSLSTFRDNWVFNWDGHNKFWKGRVMDSNGRYPDDMTNSKYGDAQIWSAVLFSLNGLIGRNATDSLILQTHYAYAENISFLDAGELLMYADTILTNGKYACPIYMCLFAHGLQPSNPFINCTVGIDEPQNWSSFQFSSNTSSFSVTNNSNAKIKVQLTNVTGQQTMLMDDDKPLFTYENPNLPAGIYLISVQLNGEVKTYKWSKAN